jgi:hypothetical protein
MPNASPRHTVCSVFISHEGIKKDDEAPSVNYDYVVTSPFPDVAFAFDCSSREMKPIQ